MTRKEYKLLFHLYQNIVGPDRHFKRVILKRYAADKKYVQQKFYTHI